MNMRNTGGRMDSLMLGAYRKALLTIGIVFCLFSSVFADHWLEGT